MSLAVGFRTTYIVTDLGELYSWGENDVFQLGQLGQNVVLPTKIHQFGNMVASVTVKDERAACVLKDGTVFTWGEANCPTLLPVNTVNAAPLHLCRNDLCGERATQVECNELFTYTLTDLGSVFQNSAVVRELDPNDPVPEDIDRDTILTVEFRGQEFYRHNTPLFRVDPVHFSNMRIGMIAAGTYHVLASGLYKGLFTWGRNTDGCLGRGEGAYLTTDAPFPVPAFEDHRLKYLSAGLRHSMVVSAGTFCVNGVRTDDAGVFGWGSNLAGQLGVGGDIIQYSRPVRIDPAHFNNESIIMIACSVSCTAVLSVTGKMWIFGDTNRMSNKYWSIQHALHARGISQTDRQATGDSDEMSEESASESDSDSENETEHTNKINETKYIQNSLPQRVRQMHVLEDRFSSLAVGNSHIAATTKHGHLYMFYGGIIPASYRPFSDPASLTGVDLSALLRQDYFGGSRIAQRPARYHESGMSRRDTAHYARGLFRSNIQFAEYRNRALVKRLQYMQRHNTVVEPASEAGRTRVDLLP